MVVGDKIKFMKSIHYILALLIGFTLVSCENNGDKKLDTDVVKNVRSGDHTKRDFLGPRIYFDKTEHNFGRVISGELVRHSFKFTNKGQEDLILVRVSSSCGCTVPNYSKEPIKPGQKGLIEVIFDTRGRKGYQNKTVTVITNTTPNKTLLKIKANIHQPEKN